MKAMILAAGLGTRLRPLTDHRPKALIQVGGVPLLEIVIRRLIRFGFRDIIINVHHFAEQVIAFIEEKNSFGVHIAISDEREQLLETGGGLKKAASFFSDGKPFLLCNTDILSDIDLQQFYQSHLDNKALASLAVQWRETSRYLIFDSDLVLNGWLNKKDGQVKLMRGANEQLQMLAFSGIHVIDPKIFSFFPDKEKFSIIDVYLEAAKTELIKGYRHDGGLWVDVGKVASLKEAERVAKRVLP